LIRQNRNLSCCNVAPTVWPVTPSLTWNIRHVARRLKLLAERHCGGRLLVLGGGGYNRDNLARAWTAVIEALLGESH